MLMRSVMRGLSIFAGIFATSLMAVPFVEAASFFPVESERFADRSEPLVTLIQVRPAGVKRRLRKNGYSNISIIDRRPPGFTVKACKSGKRYRLHIHRRGRIVERENIGRCGSAGAGGRKGLTPPQVRRDLRDRGFEEIRFLDRDLPVYVATACKNRVRFKLRMNRWAKVQKKTRVGRCGSRRAPRSPREPPHMSAPSRDDVRDEEGKQPPEIRRLLERRGFRKITFIDRRLPTYIVRACKKDRRMELRIDGSGWIRGRERLGRCQVADKGMQPREVKRVLRTRGFSRIQFTDRRLPVYVVEACRHDRKFKLRLNRFARVMRKTNIGRCRKAQAQAGYKPRKIHDLLHSRGYTEVNFFDRSLPSYGVTACKRGKLFRMRLNRFAEIKNRRRVGFCRPAERAPPETVDEYEEVDEEEISGTEQIDPETCQTYLDALVRRNRIYFDVASASVRRASYSLLRRLSRVMDRCPSSRIEISGHTDSDGSREYNRDLSRRRAKTVAGFLAQEGVSLRRMTAYGYGEDQPVMRYERTERDKARNRRIEFTVIWGDDDEMR